MSAFSAVSAMSAPRDPIVHAMEAAEDGMGDYWYPVVVCPFLGHGTSLSMLASNALRLDPPECPVRTPAKRSDRQESLPSPTNVVDEPVFPTPGSRR